MTKKIISYLQIPILILILSSCENNSEMEGIDNFICTTDVSYSNDIAPLLSVNCRNCHFDGTQFPDLSNYQSVSNNAKRIKEQTQSRIMPQTGSLTQYEIDLIACWVDNGALNN